MDLWIRFFLVGARVRPEPRLIGGGAPPGWAARPGRHLPVFVPVVVVPPEVLGPVSCRERREHDDTWQPYPGAAVLVVQTPCSCSVPRVRAGGAGGVLLSASLVQGLLQLACPSGGLCRGETLAAVGQGLLSQGGFRPHQMCVLSVPLSS